MTIRKGIVSNIQFLSDNRQSSRTYYAVPGFCDAYVTLGVNPWGGESSPDAVKQALQSFVAHGFTAIESVGDGKWVTKVQTYLNKGQWKGPVLSQSRPPILPDPGYSVPESLYQVIHSDEEMKEYLSKPTAKNTHIFHRNLGNYIPDLRFLYKLRMNHSQDRIWAIHSFADPQSSLDAIATGWTHIFHPIQANPPKFQLETIHWSPLMAIYYYQTIQDPISWEKEREDMFRLSPFFKINYEEVSKILPDSMILDSDKRDKAIQEYELYKEQLYSRQVMGSKLIFASGTGNPMVYPGLGGWKEMEIWEDAFANWAKTDRKELRVEAENLEPTSFLERFRRLFQSEPNSKQISHPKIEIGKVPRHRAEFLNVLTKNSCEYVNAGHRGRIGEKLEANFILYEKNPLESKDGLYKPHSVYVKGILQSGKKLEK